MKSLMLSLVALSLTSTAWASPPVAAAQVDLGKAFKALKDAKPLSTAEMKATKGAGECITIAFDNGGVSEVFDICW